MERLSKQIGNGNVGRIWKPFWVLAHDHFIRIQNQAHWSNYKIQFAGWQRNSGRGFSSEPLGEARLVGFIRKDEGGNFTRLRLTAPGTPIAKEDNGNAAVFVLDFEDWRAKLPKDIGLIGDEDPPIGSLETLTDYMRRQRVEFGPHAAVRSFVLEG
jgi:hypothetical protein